MTKLNIRISLLVSIDSTSKEVLTGNEDVHRVFNSKVSINSTSKEVLTADL